MSKTIIGVCFTVCVVCALCITTLVVIGSEVAPQKFHSLVYTVYGEIQTAECVDDFHVHSENGYISYSEDGLTLYIKPDMLAVKEHTHE
jgi:hypothetical protein